MMWPCLRADCSSLASLAQPDLGTAHPFPETQIILCALQLFDPPAKPIPIMVTDAEILLQVDRVDIDLSFGQASWPSQSPFVSWTQTRSTNQTSGQRNHQAATPTEQCGADARTGL